MFKNAIVKRLSKSLVNGITSAPELGKPDYELALKQHDAYIAALENCGVAVTVLEASEAQARRRPVVPVPAILRKRE